MDVPDPLAAVATLLDAVRMNAGKRAAIDAAFRDAIDAAVRAHDPQLAADAVDEACSASWWRGYVRGCDDAAEDIQRALGEARGSVRERAREATRAENDAIVAGYGERRRLLGAGSVTRGCALAERDLRQRTGGER